MTDDLQNFESNPRGALAAKSRALEAAERRALEAEKELEIMRDNARQWKNTVFTLQDENTALRAQLSAAERQKQQLIETSHKEVEAYGFKPRELQAKWRGFYPFNGAQFPEYNSVEVEAAIIDALCNEGIPAWHGDAVGCVRQIVDAQAKRADAAAQREARMVEAMGEEWPDMYESLRAESERKGVAHFEFRWCQYCDREKSHGHQSFCRRARFYAALRVAGDQLVAEEKS